MCNYGLKRRHYFHINFQTRIILIFYSPWEGRGWGTRRTCPGNVSLAWCSAWCPCTGRPQSSPQSHEQHCPQLFGTEVTYTECCQSPWLWKETRKHDRLVQVKLGHVLLLKATAVLTSIMSALESVVGNNLLPRTQGTWGIWVIPFRIFTEFQGEWNYQQKHS